ncbi:hypothetical protein MATL_G00236830 [Megalops atlanticus]|uniref:CCN family member 1 n=1 Tax=Megalops atlanticus TaxID=7932 RepID=A0A9D3SX34_MEGAT|nr:hypothetical protein MATL_G00236830 [Megalops atlanticus]
MEMFSLVIFMGSLSLAFPSCPSECACPLEAPRCAPGVSLALDGCGCCKVCARQLNEDCSQSQPCDHGKGLQCNFGASRGASKGICRAKSEGRPCEYNSKIYQNGETFQPNCKHLCTCMDGAVGCSTLCPQELSLPRLGCAHPRLLKVPGRCCEEWHCKPLSKDSSTASENDLSKRHPLTDLAKAPLKSLPAFGVPAESRMFERQKCAVQTTAWSQCSKTCGTGVSTRVSNNNGDCRVVRETRLCQVRSCAPPTAASAKKGRRCSRPRRAPQAEPLRYAGCSSISEFRLRSCGTCADGRCCSPLRTRTVPVRFRCADGEIVKKNVMLIQSCKCTFDCPPTSEASHPRYPLLNDIRKFRD